MSRAVRVCMLSRGSRTVDSFRDNLFPAISYHLHFAKLLFNSIKQIQMQNAVEISPSTLQCTLLSPVDSTTKPFTFDGVYDQDSTTEQIYTDFGFSLVEVGYYSYKKIASLLTNL